jgi:hypothetical protein
MIITYEQLVKDYNEYYQENVRVVRCNTNDIFEIMFNIYDTDDFEINEDEETIELFFEICV